MVIQVGDWARQSVIVSPVPMCFCSAQGHCRSSRKRSQKMYSPTSLWAQSGCAFRIQRESSPKQDRLIPWATTTYLN